MSEHEEYPTAFGWMPPGLTSAVKNAVRGELWVRDLVLMGYAEEVAKGMVIGAGLTCMQTYEAPSHAIHRMVRAARAAQAHPDSAPGTL